MVTACLGLFLVHALGAAAGPAPATESARERRLHVAAAEASSYLQNDWNRFQENYLPLYVGDDDPRTAWNLKTEGIGEWIRLRVTPMQGATHVRFRIRNGFQKSQALFAANSRAKQLTVVLLPSGKTADVDVKDAFGWQEIAVDQPAGPLDAVELRVKAVYSGKKYDDLCLSDVQLFVTATTPDNPAYEKQHYEKIVTWKKGRAAAATLFKTELGKTLPVAARYTVTTNEPEMGVPSRRRAQPRCSDDACWMSRAFDAAAATVKTAAHAAALKTARDLAAHAFAGMTPVRVSARDKRPVPRVDGLCAPSLDACEEDPCLEALPLPITNQTGYLRSDGVALIEQSGLPSFADATASGESAKVPACRTRAGGTFAWAWRDPAAGAGLGRLRALLLLRCGLAEGREGPYAAHRSQLLVYGDEGQLQLTAGPDQSALLDWTTDPNGSKLAGGQVAWRYGGQMVIKAAPEVASR